MDTTPQENGTGEETGLYFAIIYKIDFDQIFKHCIIIYKIEMFKKYFPSGSVISKVICFYQGS